MKPEAISLHYEENAYLLHQQQKISIYMSFLSLEPSTIDQA
jgi:hypothetical protein